MQCPFTGERLAAVPAINPDVTILHAQRADRHGNVAIHGIVGAQREAALAARALIVTVEEIVDELPPAMNGIVLPHWVVSAVAQCPGGAYPSYVHDHYARDNDFYQRWDAIARDRDGFRAWMDKHVLASADHAQFLASLRGGRVSDVDREEMMTIAAARLLAGRLRVLRRHRPAERRVQPRAPDPCARHRADLRIRHARARVPNVLPLSIGDGELAETAACVIPLPEVFSYYLQAGRVDVGFLGAAQVDRYGNLNSTVIGPYDAPTTRLPGAGGATEIAAHARQTFVMLKATPRSLVAQLDFRTSAGFLEGHGARAQTSMRGAGPRAVITDYRNADTGARRATNCS